MDETIVCFSFDDGRIDNYRLAKDYLLPNGISASFNITTGFIDGTAPYCIKASGIKPMTIDNIRWIYGQKEKFEIALHGDKHRNDVEDIENGHKKICEWLSLPEDSKFGFASPFSILTMQEIENNNELLNLHYLLYIRGGVNNIGRLYNSANDLSDKIMTRIKRGDVIGRTLRHYVETSYYQKKMSRMMNEDSFIQMVPPCTFLYSVVVYRSTSPEMLIDLVKYALKKKKSIIFMMHSVSENEEDNDPYTYRKRDFVEFCEYLMSEEKNKKLSIETVKKMQGKLEER